VEQVSSKLLEAEVSELTANFVEGVSDRMNGIKEAFEGGGELREKQLIEQIVQEAIYERAKKQYKNQSVDITTNIRIENSVVTTLGIDNPASIERSNGQQEPSTKREQTQRREKKLARRVQEKGERVKRLEAEVIRSKKSEANKVKHKYSYYTKKI
jgi:hypothetical protein